jgi:hypothetical protein
LARKEESSKTSVSVFSGRRNGKITIRKRADSGNVDILRAMRARGVRFKQPAFSTTVKKGGRRQLGRCAICPTGKDRRTDWKHWQCLECVCKNHTVKTIQIKCKNFQELSGKIHLHFHSKPYLFVLKKLCISFCIVT